ncbi:hypothetical protein O1611_g783 [Lasiodiplodia mahajangana]|uniref:Uncharacterized protein n=1 Tax=Lasiodiplodia mahajangana TaxID=1108764 RepID=A0ACC2JZX4_9PEZI|nr:hypothetical protein O1611_g783 [Lasiodiplodia mahajangana]
MVWYCSHACNMCGRAKTACVFSRRAIPKRPDRIKISTTKKDNRSDLTTVPRELKMRPYFGATVDNHLLLGAHSIPASNWNSNAVEGGDPRMVVGQIGLVNPGISFWNEDGTVRAAGTEMEWSFLEPGTFANPTLISNNNIQGSSIPPYPRTYGAELHASQLSAQPNVSERSFGYGTLEDWNRSVTSQLMDLIAEIAGTRVVLDNSLCPNGLNDYPIGRVLHLSQYFINILSSGAQHAQNIEPVSVLEPTSTAYPEPQDPSIGQASQTSLVRKRSPIEPIHPSKQHLPTQSLDRNHSPRFSKIHEAVDTSTMLIVLSCYISLVKLYGLVFTHLQAYLNSPSIVDSTQGSAESDLIYNRQLQLGDLLPGNEACRKIMSAMQMLISMLGSVEDQMGIPGELKALQEPGDRARAETAHSIRLQESKGGLLWTTSQRELMLVVLRQDSELCQGKAEGQLIDVFTKIQALKRALRERMDL